MCNPRAKPVIFILYREISVLKTPAGKIYKKREPLLNIV
jgi:hypothetical protein